LEVRGEAPEDYPLPKFPSFRFAGFKRERENEGDRDIHKKRSSEEDSSSTSSTSFDSASLSSTSTSRINNDYPFDLSPRRNFSAGDQEKEKGRRDFFEVSERDRLIAELIVVKASTRSLRPLKAT